MSARPRADSVPRFVATPAAPYLRSLEVDRALAADDLAGSLAHAEMLARAGLLTAEELRSIRGGLRRIAREVADGTFPWRPELEDVHTNVEVRLTELIGPAGGKLHTGRSRNDQVAVDERLWLRRAVDRVGGALLNLARTLRDRAAAEVETVLPGYTHLQRAQPVTLAHHLLAHFWRLDRDLDRLFAAAERANVSPLGAGALAGSTLPIDPRWTAARLGFAASFANSLDAVSDRDYFVELAGVLALAAVHLSALGEEVVLWATAEFGFLPPHPALGGGSSLMPQKRNPDVAELARASAGRATADLLALLVTLKGLPLAYDRDLQEDKAPVLDAVATVERTARSLTDLLAAVGFDRGRMAAAARDPGLYATDALEASVARGEVFRRAHESWTRAGPPVAAPDPSVAVARRSGPGGPGPAAVREQLAAADARIAAHSASLSSIARRVRAVDELLEEDDG